MAVQKPSIPKGTRDFGRLEMARRNYIFDTIKTVFRSYGYSQIETPSMENLSTLLGKYGDEGDKLLFRILNSGDAFADITADDLGSKSLPLKVCEKGLRYDLTVPFARYVVQHQGEISFPFKRFQIQPVWRADRPQKGRYREFYQCDVDVIGSESLLNELELVQIVDDVFGKLGINVAIKINNRKVLTGFAEIAGAPDKVTDITVAIDKLEKIGLEKVLEELQDKEIPQSGIEVIKEILSLSGSLEVLLEKMRAMFNGGASLGIESASGLKGLEEVETLFSLIGNAGIKSRVELDLSLARGLNYYTGAIFEVKALDWEIGSISGGGRYDNLTGIFGLPGLSGVGISFGADRIYDVLTGLDLFPESLSTSAKILFANMGGPEAAYCVSLAGKLRKEGIDAVVYPDSGKLKKQFDFADRNSIPFISINGSDEIASGSINIKNLQSGEQKLFPANDIASIKDFLK